LRGPLSAARFHKKLAPAVVGLLSLCLCLASWQLASVYEWDFFFRFENVPAPSEVAAAFGELLSAPKLAAHVGSKPETHLRRLLPRRGVGGVPRAVDRALPARRACPVAAARSAATGAGGGLDPARHSAVRVGRTQHDFITFIGAFFPILLNTIHGVQTLDRRLVSASLTLGAGPFDVFREVILPGAAPSIVTGLSIGMGTSWFSLVTAEMISGQYGIGYYTWEAYTLQKYPSIVLGMIAIGILGMGSSLCITWCGRRLMPWFVPSASAP
jgi:NitT/TauT family transport system permease protein